MVVALGVRVGHRSFGAIGGHVKIIDGSVQSTGSRVYSTTTDIKVPGPAHIRPIPFHIVFDVGVVIGVFCPADDSQIGEVWIDASRVGAIHYGAIRESDSWVGSGGQPVGGSGYVGLIV